MVSLLTNLAAVEVTDASFKMLGVAVVIACASVSLGMVGSNYMKALGRNPEAGKAASSIIILAAFVEATALFALIAGLIVK
jgi:F-type H+-transporting ATPase subunit c